jgi:4-deoxy-L-threo-5-hexosulose-uronate ketol-isomerase
MLHATPSPYPLSQTVRDTSPVKRKVPLHAIVSHTQETRAIEAFDARPTVNKVQQIITAKNSSFKYLRLSRLVLDIKASDYMPHVFSLKTEEAVYYVNDGKGEALIGDKIYKLSPGDALYVGIHQSIEIRTARSLDISEYKAISCTHSFPNTLQKHKKIETTPFAANLGTKRAMTKRTVYKLLDGGNIKACRLLFGDTYVTQPGAVGSYPPHFHGPDGKFGYGSEAKEEIYHFRIKSDIPADVPFVLQNCQRPEEPLGSYFTVRDDQAINVTPGYHDTIAPPPVSFMFVWCLASFTECKRDWSQVKNKAGYENEW